MPQVIRQLYSNPVSLKHNTIATTNPTVNDDETEGYSIGSIWVNTLTGVCYTCVCDIDSAAVWISGVSIAPYITAGMVGNTIAQWNASQICGQVISTDTPDNEDILIWNSSTNKWEISDAFSLHVDNVSNPHSVTKSQVGLANVTNDSQLKRAGNDWSGFTQKTTTISNDRILLEDSADSYNKKYSTVGAIDHDVIYNIGNNSHLEIDAHISSASNPHSVTKTQIGLSNVPNTDCTDADNINDGNTNGIPLLTEISDWNSHLSNTSNPHSVTKSQVGLGNVDNSQQVPLSQKGVASGVCELDANGKVPTNRLNVSSLTYKGGWDASSNSPSLSSSGGGGAQGDYYVVSVAGTTSIDGVSSWEVKDWITHNGTIWQKIDNTDSVTSVAGRQGAVTLTKSDVGLSNVPNTDCTNADNISSGSTNGIPTNTQISNWNAHINNTSNPHSVTKTQIGLGNVINTLSKFDAVVAPTVNNDSSQGYSVGSIWINTSTSIIYICTNATIGSAAWAIITTDSAYDSLYSRSLFFQVGASNALCKFGSNVAYYEVYKAGTITNFAMRNSSGSNTEHTLQVQVNGVTQYSKVVAASVTHFAVTLSVEVVIGDYICINCVGTGGANETLELFVKAYRT